MTDRVNTQTAPYPTELAALVDACTYRPGWLVLLRDEIRDPASTHEGETRGLTLSIITETINSYPPHQPMRVRHLFAVPAATYNRESWQHWLFERFLDVERHECMEFFTIGEEKPYAPNHGPGWDPYLITAVATTDIDRRTSFRGEVNPEREPGIPTGECFICGEDVEFIDGSWRHMKAANYDHHPSRGDVTPTVASPLLTGEEADRPAAPGRTPPRRMTTRVRLCDDDGMVSHELMDPPPSFQPHGLTYLGLLNNLRSHTDLAPVTEPFVCTGSAHLADTVFHCTSPAHHVPDRTEKARRG